MHNRDATAEIPLADAFLVFSQVSTSQNIHFVFSVLNLLFFGVSFSFNGLGSILKDLFFNHMKEKKI